MLTDSPSHVCPATAGCARDIGRVGSLAVALGIGAAVATGFGMGIAQADDTGTSETSPSVDSPSDSPAPSSRGRSGGSADTSRRLVPSCRWGGGRQGR